MKMKINPHATVVPFLVVVDLAQCSLVSEFDISNPERYQYFVIGGSHSAEARRKLVMEHPTTYFFKYAECKIYVGLTLMRLSFSLGTTTTTMIIGRRCPL